MKRDKISIWFWVDNVLFFKEYLKRVNIFLFFFFVKVIVMSVWMVLWEEKRDIWLLRILDRSLFLFFFLVLG